MGVKDRAKRARKAAAAAEAEANPPALLGQNPDLVLATVVDVFHKVGELGCALWPSILLHELLPGSALEEGFGVIDARMCYRAIWVSFKGERYDPATAILRALNETFTEPVALALDPVGPRVDDQDDGGKAESETRQSLALYRVDPDEWWRRAPPGLTRIRKFLRK